MYTVYRDILKHPCTCYIVDIEEVQHCCPALVQGEKEIAMALAEGKFPVIDTTTDVFAVISSPGTCR